MLSLQRYDRAEAAFLDDLFRKHRLVPGWMMPDHLLGLAMRARVEAIQDDDNGATAAYLLTTQTLHCLEVTVVIEDRHITERLDDLAAIGVELADLWFDGTVRRVQGVVPTARRNYGRLLSALGFDRETRGEGLALAVDVGGRLENAHIYGLVRPEKDRTINVVDLAEAGL